jgi:response regulator RpfG family c-di-GMP phosphodiesterase
MKVDAVNSLGEEQQSAVRLSGTIPWKILIVDGENGVHDATGAIADYDIDDYLKKNNVTVQTLKTIIFGRLRAHHDLCAIDFQRDALSRILGATSNDQNTQSLIELAESVLGHLKTLLDVPNPELYCLVEPINPEQKPSKNGPISLDQVRQAVIYRSTSEIPDQVLERLRQVKETKVSMHFDDAFVTYNVGRDESNDNLMYVQHGSHLGSVQLQLLELYAQSVAITFENINLHNNLQETQKELVYLLGEAVEARSKETGAHVKRVAICSGKLATLIGLSASFVNLITLASPLHDIGKVAIPDQILHKPGKLEGDEWEIMKRHAEYGRDILIKSTNLVMRMGARIAYSHHERWDGTGYPVGLKGEDIPLEGRITALVDVYDALGSKRSYKDAWDIEKIKATLIQGRGGHFDPELVDVFVANMESFNAVRQEFPDT